jgi:hypothetical protein
MRPVLVAIHFDIEEEMNDDWSWSAVSTAQITHATMTAIADDGQMWSLRARLDREDAVLAMLPAPDRQETQT